MAIKSINPYSQQVLKEFDALSVTNIQEKLSTVQARFTSWRKTSFEERARLMEKAADVMESKKTYYASLMTQEMGKLSSEALAEVEKCTWCCRYYATHAADFLKDELIETDASKSYLHYEPLGVILAIMPWNFPFWQVIRFAAPTLMAGNVGVLKHASNVPQCALALEEIFTEAGFPEGVFQTLLMNTSDIEEVIKHPAVKAVTLTGSEGAGASVAALAGKYLKKTVLELGGSDPFIILEDVDIANVAKMAVKGRMINAGQSCIAAKRFIVVKSIAEAFIDAFKEEMEKL
ncbi:MAG: aldehyde dehydrogenase family protein, partial [Bacteroidota bacterium]